MGQEFCIYPKACMAEVQGIEQEIAKLVSCAGRLDGLKNSIGQNSSGSYRNIAEAIRGIAEAVRQEQEQLTAWKNALEKSVAQYQSTESTIAKGISDYNSTVKDKINTFEDTIIEYEDFTDSELYKIIDDLIERGILDEDVLQALITMWNGTYLTSNKIGNTIYLGLKNNGMTNREISAWLSEQYGGTWSDYVARNLKNGKLDLYDLEKGALGKGAKYFDEAGNVQDFLKTVNKSLKTSMSETFITSFFSDFNYNNFKSMTTLGKAGKILGTAGTVLTIGTDVFDNFYDKDTDAWTFSGNQTADCAVDIGIDLASVAASATAGAAIGSLLPPVGTVVGAAAGITINVLSNWDAFDWNGDGEKDSLVDGAKMGAHVIVDKIEDAGSNVCNWLGNVFSF